MQHTSRFFLLVITQLQYFARRSFSSGGRLRYKNKIAVARRSRWHLHIPFLVTEFPPEVPSLSLFFPLGLSLSLFFPLGLSLSLAPPASSPPRASSTWYWLPVFERGGIIKRRTSKAAFDGISYSVQSRSIRRSVALLRQKRRASGNARTMPRKTAGAGKGGGGHSREPPPRPND